MYFAALHADTERSQREEVRELRRRARLFRRTLRRCLRRLARQREEPGRALGTGRQTVTKSELAPWPEGAHS
jgi:hypothetical protein